MWWWRKQIPPKSSHGSTKLYRVISPEDFCNILSLGTSVLFRRSVDRKHTAILKPHTVGNVELNHELLAPELYGGEKLATGSGPFTAGSQVGKDPQLIQTSWPKANPGKLCFCCSWHWEIHSRKHTCRESCRIFGRSLNRIQMIWDFHLLWCDQTTRRHMSEDYNLNIPYCLPAFRPWRWSQ
jgi:hypothetical protein